MSGRHSQAGKIEIGKRLEQGRQGQEKLKQEKRGWERPESKRTKWERDKCSLEREGYIVGQLLGQGAFSKVYSVEERRTGRRAACKISENIRLLKREEEILKKLRHPLFPEYYGSWREEKTGFLLMEEVSGENLAELIRRGEKLSIYQIAEIGMKLAEGLLYLHESPQVIIFRDVKPENIILGRDGRVKLLDFGCACMPDKDNGTRAGTPGFAAPEQLMEGGGQTHLCDVYGLGRTLQELLWAGERQGGMAQLPEGRNGRQGLLEGSDGTGRFREGRWERRDRKRLERLLAACVEMEPSARPADMRVIMAALSHLCAPVMAGGRHRAWNKGWYGKQCSDFWQKGILCEKNILKSTWKTS